ncbi:MAG: hypothetical protein LKG19_02960 [Saprospiraceae bacterium]|jgi:hypothetical protein|nr:hypothetical protein [Saprospiraceae bacterium]
MKKMRMFVFSICCIAIINMDLAAQNTKDLFSNSELPITWLGLDFSEVRYIGDPGTVDAIEMKKLFVKINDLIIQEPNKFKIGAAFQKSNISNDISATQKVNENMNAGNILSYNDKDEKRINEQIIKKIINSDSYSSAGKGVGLLFIVESLNKNKESASVWIAFINLDKHTLIFSERVEGKASGFGFRNHWAGSINSILKDIKSSLYNKWRNKSN